MWVHDKVRADAAFTEGEVLLKEDKGSVGDYQGHTDMRGSRRTLACFFHTCRTMLPRTPFCPWRLLNLSPSSGRLVCRIMTLMLQWESSLPTEHGKKDLGWRARPCHDTGAFATYHHAAHITDL